MVNSSPYTEASSDDFKFIHQQLKQQKEKKKQWVEAAHRKALQTAEKEMDGMRKRKEALVLAQRTELQQLYTTIKRDVAEADDEIERLLQAADAVLAGFKGKADAVAKEITEKLEAAAQGQVEGLEGLQRLVEAEHKLPFEVSGGRVNPVANQATTLHSMDSQELFADDAMPAINEDDLVSEDDEVDAEELEPTDTEEDSLDG